MTDRKLLRILVVDDDGDILDLLKYNLEKEGFRIKTLANSDKTIAVAKAFSPDLIILDIMMPHPNGIELCRELRSMKRFENTYIFFLTARSERYYQQAALNTGGDD
jgi:two-component system, OmpR family, alkaline phosphatase synthesis response regulator PhoP